MDEKSAARAGAPVSVAASDVTASSHRRLLGVAANTPRRGSAAAAVWSDDIVRQGTAAAATPRDALAAALGRDASSVAAALGLGSGRARRITRATSQVGAHLGHEGEN
jgi:hypothetical protein